jgi:hypothetical protein
MMDNEAGSPPRSLCGFQLWILTLKRNHGGIRIPALVADCNVTPASMLM